MSLTINTNLLSIAAQNNLNTSQSALSSAVARLSSGMRINSAADDAAGYAIAQRMSAQINGDMQASQNAQNGVSLVQTALGALSSITSNLQSIRQLAVQSANGTNSSGDQANLNTQAQQLLQEIDRVTSQTQYNGVNLLDGSFANQQIQVGANAGQVINVGTISSTSSATLGSNNAAQVTGAAATSFGAISAGDLQINGVSVGPIAAATSATERAGQIRDAINSVSGQTKVYATNDTSTTVSLNTNDPTTGGITVLQAGTGTTATTGLTNATTALTTTTGFSSLSLTTTAGSNTAITQMDNALNAANTLAASLGALQNRLTSTVSNLQTITQNLQSAHSGITDANFAQETANMTRASILQQAGVSVLAQANSSPQAVLKLLQ
jgi:flagellin